MKICSVAGCGLPHSAKGMCRLHYYRQHLNRKPLLTLGMTPKERVEFYTRKGEGIACWEWVGAKNAAGYGLVSINNRRHLVTRTVWAWENGNVPPGLHVLHRCDNPACVRIDHLFVGTHADNMRDMVTKGRNAVGERAGNCKLSNAQLEAIRKSTEPQRTLAEQYGVSQATISNVRTGRRSKRYLSHTPVTE